MVFVQAGHLGEDHVQPPVAAGFKEILVDNASRGGHMR